MDEYMLSKGQLHQLADALFNAANDQTPIEPITITHSEATITDAYSIQLLNIDRRIEAGAQRRGHKVGLTAKAMQQMLGVGEPDFGHLLSDMFFDDGDDIECSTFCAPKIEVETAFVLKSDLTGPRCNPVDVLRATEFVVPVFELIDSRIRDWKIGLIDTIADNASAAGVVLGNPARSPMNLDLRLMGVVLSHNGEIVETGAGAAVLGNPVNAVAWLVNKLSALGESIPAGSVVLPGSCTRAIDVAAGDVIRADFDQLGSVSVNFR